MLATNGIPCRAPRVGSFLRLAILCCLALGSALASAAAAPLQEVRSFRATHERAILHELVRLLEIPNVARNEADKAAIRRNAEAIAAMLKERGLTPQLLEPAGMPDTPPLVYARWSV